MMTLFELYFGPEGNINGKQKKRGQPSRREKREQKNKQQLCERNFVIRIKKKKLLLAPGFNFD